jgi:hypothetical protein
MKMQQTEKVQCIGIVGLLAQRMLIAGLRVVEAASLMRGDGVEERRVCVRHFLVRLQIT